MTVAIKGVRDYKKFVAYGSDTLRWFNSYFNRVSVRKIKPTNQGTLLIEFYSTEDATRVADSWNPSYFGGDGCNTSACLLSQTGSRHRAVVQFIERDMDLETIADAIVKKYNFRPSTIARLTGRGNLPSPSVVVSFVNERQRDLVLQDSLPIGAVMHPVRIYYERARVQGNQCRKCYAFGHPAVWCPNSERCPHCAGPHPGQECTASELNCPNCTTNNNHSATSEQCPVLSARLNAVQHD